MPIYIGNSGLDFFLLIISLGVAELLSGFISMYVTKNSDAKILLIVFCALCCVSSVGALVFETFMVHSAEN